MSFYTGSALFIIFCVRALEIEAPGFLACPPCQGVQQLDFGVLCTGDKTKCIKEEQLQKDR